MSQVKNFMNLYGVSMKILQINNVYKKGSTGKITYDIHQGLQKNGIDSVVCYGRGQKTNESNVYKTCGELYSKINNVWSRITGIMYGGCFFSTSRLISIIKKEKPDVVHLQCLNGYFVNIYRLIHWLKKNKIKTVLTLHAEFMYTGGCGHSIDCNQWSTRNGCGHSICPRWRSETKSLFFDRTAAMWKKMKKSFEGFNDNLIVVSVSPWLMERAKLSPIFEDKRHEVVLNGLDISIFHSYDTVEIKKKYGLKDEKIIFHATPDFNDDPNHIKGGYYVIKLAEMMKSQNVKFIVAGKYREGLKVPNNIILLGKVNDQTLLAKYYSMADITLLTSRKETFSMVTAESLCCRTPVVGFKAGAPEQIALPEYSCFVEYGNIEQLYNAVNSKLNDKNFVDIDKVKSKYSADAMCSKYINLYHYIVKNNKI